MDSHKGWLGVGMGTLKSARPGHACMACMYVRVSLPSQKLFVASGGPGAELCPPKPKS